MSERGKCFMNGDRKCYGCHALINGECMFLMGFAQIAGLAATIEEIVVEERANQKKEMMEMRAMLQTLTDLTAKEKGGLC